MDGCKNYNLQENFCSNGLVPIAPVELITDSVLSNRSTSHLLMLRRALQFKLSVVYWCLHQGFSRLTVS